MLHKREAGAAEKHSDEKTALIHPDSRLHSLNHLDNVSCAGSVTLSVTFLVGGEHAARERQDAHRNNTCYRKFSAFHGESSSVVLDSY
jgi:hypothetical protein